MKALLILIIALRLTAVPARGQDTFEYLDADAWIGEVESIHNSLQTPLAFERYDERIIRDWLMYTVVDRPAPEKCSATDFVSWNLQALAAYGLKDDLRRLDHISETLRDGGYNPPEIDYYRLALLAKHGDESALEQIKNASTDVAIWVLPFCRTKAARDELAAIATNQQRKFLERKAAAWALCKLGDDRGLLATLNSEFTRAMSATDVDDPSAMFARVTGLPELLDITDPDKAWAIIKAKNLTLLPAKKKSVKGPIDWSKYRVKAGLPPLPATPERSPLPKKIRQPKPEKPAAAAASAQKPPADNAGKLIAAAVAIVGLLAVLIWFWRKK